MLTSKLQEQARRVSLVVCLMGQDNECFQGGQKFVPPLALKFELEAMG